MQFSVLQIATIILATATDLSQARLHTTAVCIDKRINHFGQKTFSISPNATHCACTLYRARDTGTKVWDKCQDCTFEDFKCISKNGTIGGDEFTYYCEKKCGAKGAEAS
ncbi:hypothetical protein PgNI_05328 [Pyricularia grisea]|uniref:Uncharacterized protein n=1 Tax=Pyricularia grisea TaxID=148305 RepID=A0A6P8B8H4_PYRGI|nr:hypothetical protein PgNI_05328 [Pyricularia grisea]TLD11414.1 hypothetical protein PgNI_05328 [Pyricularia grisea]